MPAPKTRYDIQVVFHDTSLRWTSIKEQTPEMVAASLEDIAKRIRVCLQLPEREDTLDD
jgi:hypothetical protein